MINRNNTVILYGSYGYTGRLIAQECQSKNLNLILAGRNHEALLKQSMETGYPCEVVDILDPLALKRVLCKGKVVIHCGGPFQFTAMAMAMACIETGTHYTDISGEYQVFEMLAGFDEEARKAGITLLPGTGFDVVPSDCLALHLKNRLPAATHLQLAFVMSSGGLSRGTAKTMIEGLGAGSVVRKAGKLVNVPLGEKVMEVDFGPAKSLTMNIPWGDIATAWRSTGIPNIEVYMGATPKMIGSAKMSKYLSWLLRRRWVKGYLQKKVDQKPPGPSEERRLSGKSFLWGRVWDSTGKECVSTLKTINGYSLTAKTSTLIAEKILNGNMKAGYQTPARAYGTDLILEIESTTRIDH